MDTTPIDERGHTREQAQAQHPALDLDATPASQETPAVSGSGEVDTGDVLVPAQTPEEVQAQIDNPAGAPGETHDQSEQMAAAAEYEGDSIDTSSFSDTRSGADSAGDGDDDDEDDLDGDDDEDDEDDGA